MTGLQIHCPRSFAFSCSFLWLLWFLVSLSILTLLLTLIFISSTISSMITFCRQFSTQYVPQTRHFSVYSYSHQFLFLSHPRSFSIMLVYFTLITSSPQQRLKTFLLSFAKHCVVSVELTCQSQKR